MVVSNEESGTNQLEEYSSCSVPSPSINTMCGGGWVPLEVQSESTSRFNIVLKV